MKRIIVFILLFIFAFGITAQEFSADMISKSGGKEFKSKIFTSNGKSRMESGTGNSASIMITRPDKKVVWILMPGKMYMEQAFSPDKVTATKEKMPGEIERKNLGKETIDGISTDKFKITYTVESKKETVLAWFDKDGFPIKMSEIDNKWSMEYKNIKKGKQEQSLFEIPAGYKKFEMPKR